MSDSERSVLACPECREPLEPRWDSRPACATPIGSGDALTCPTCGRPIDPHWRLCPTCGAALAGHASASELGGRRGGASVPPGASGQEEIFVSMLTAGVPGAAAHTLALPITQGDMLGDRYTVHGRLGAGSFGAVYRVHDAVMADDMALKVVVASEGQGKPAQAMEQILHEFRLRKRISDVGHIVTSEDPRPCDYKGLSLVLVPMELADGGSLRQWLARNRDVEKRRKEGIQLFKHACQGTRAIHEAGLVHLDIKPENILLADGKAKVTDLGIGRLVGLDFEGNPGRLLRQGVGTPQYMSPEQFQTARQKDIDSRSDIYSLALVLYEILDGGLPFDGSPIELRDKHLRMAPPQLGGSAGRWWAVVARCLAKNPEDRYPDVAALLTDIERVAQGAALSVDVACPACGHINANADQRTCESCRADLVALFRPCPRCTRQVRLDTERCPGCGEPVLAHYVLQERWRTVERLKDEDPAEAVELLEVVLREGAREIQDRAAALVRDLRRKQGRMSDLIAQARTATVDGRPEEALAAWCRVLEIIPRHRLAQNSNCKQPHGLTEGY